MNLISDFELETLAKHYSKQVKKLKEDMKFSIQEDRFLKRNYKKIPAKTMGRMLGRCESSARQRMILLGIVVPSEIALRFKKENQFKPEQKPFNKGKKMPAEVYKKVKKTMFKKGQMPTNHRPVGSERIDNKGGYAYVKVKEPRTWKLKHRWIWEKKRGRIPKGMNVEFKDGNRQNIKISNLVLRTRAQNMKRNTYHNYGPEIAKTIQMIGALHRQINKKSA